MSLADCKGMPGFSQNIFEALNVQKKNIFKNSIFLQHLDEPHLKLTQG